MSLRALLFRVFHNGKLLVRYIKPLQAQGPTTLSQPLPSTRLSAPASTGNPLQNYLNNARKLFVNSLLNRVTNSLSSDLRRRTLHQLLYKDNSRPFLTFVGVSLASGTGMLTKEDEMEGVCWEIRHAVNNMFEKLIQVETLPDVEDVKVEDIKIGKFIAKGTNAVVYEAVFRDVEYALKMMFNYSAASNSHAILKAMSKELIPLRKPLRLNEDMLMNDIEYLPPHPNIVVMHFAFTDFIPSIPDSSLLYPSALPARLNPTGGYGRNMSLFILMKKYNTDLRTYLREKADISMHEKILLLTQLLEGVTHLNTHRTAHRDLKSDNILLDTSEENTCPQLVITDFGNSYTNKARLSMQYSSADVELGGNVALMAPEVASATPGMFSYVNYSKSDAWTLGTIAYELFGMENPFYNTVRNTRYNVAELPVLDARVPEIVRRLVAKLLEPEPSDRPLAELAATVCQLFLWAPRHWLYGASPSHNEVIQWLLTLTTKVLCTGAGYTGHVRRTVVEYQLINTFLKRAEFRLVTEALQYIQRVLTPRPLEV